MTNKFFERHVFFCTNQRPDGHPKGCCASKNSTVLRAYMKKKTKELVSDKKIRINASGCLDHCEFGPTLVVYPDNVWYSCKTEEEVDQVINEHLINDHIAENLTNKKIDNLCIINCQRCCGVSGCKSLRASSTYCP